PRPAARPACPEAVAAIRDADWVVLGPGSWFTSVVPHLLVPELADALITTRARRLVALNLAPQPGETEGFSPHTHLEVLAEHAPELTVDIVLADRGAAGGSAAQLEKAAGLLGGRLVLADLAMRDGSPRHDPRQLAGGLGGIVGGGGAEGHDRPGEGRAEPRHRAQAMLPQGGGLHAAAVRRGPAPRGRPDRGRGRAGHRRRRPQAAEGRGRGVRPYLRADRPGPERAAQGQPLRGQGAQGR